MKNNDLILIPARSGSKTVSRQNLRLVDDKPLLYYVLNTALQYTSNVFVSTDSEEIKEISTMYGANVVLRPKSLTKDSTPLEDIIYHALSELNKKNMFFNKCLILNPKFPLIKLSTIKKFFSNLNAKTQIISGYVDDANTNYGIIESKNNHLVKLINTESHIVVQQKTIAFVCNSFLKQKKFQTPVFGLKFTDYEPLSLDNYHHFGILEKIIKRRRILVRVDGSRKIGLGHVYNMLTILNHLRNDEILILMNSKYNLGSTRFKDHLFSVKYFSSESELFRILKNFKPDIIFNDILDTSSDYVKKLKQLNLFVVNFEDLGSGRNYADLVFNPIYDDDKKHKNEFYGANYACVRDEFRIWKNKPISKTVQCVLITFGGSDPTDKTNQIFKLIREINLKDIRFLIVLGLGYTHKRRLQILISQMLSEGFRISLIEKSDFLVKHMREADFAITSNGRTVFEIASLKVPVVAISVNNREKNHKFVKNTNVGFQLDFHLKIEKHKLINSITAMLDFTTRKSFVKNLQKINLLNGADRVIQTIMSEYEKNKQSCSNP
jgi:spore coat polysaccharide biosynthesis predicted glycosyltransferase SpsG/CMP-N-acetylneuraminic acid synthetase